LSGRVASRGGVRIRLTTALAASLNEGDSLAVNGVCLTVAGLRSDEIEADVGPETLRVTTFATLGTGATVNLERPLRADSRLGGHFVLGHVDAVGRLESRRPEAEFEWFTIGFPPQYAPLIIMKGSIAVDGISLTVASLGVERFDVQIVPYTREHTNLDSLPVGGRVNLEFDMVGKYIVRAAELSGLSTHRS
jgi:riboflavin synthase